MPLAIRTYYVVADSDGFITCTSNGGLLHNSFKNATTWSDSPEGLGNAKRTQKCIPESKIYKVVASLEAVE